MKNQRAFVAIIVLGTLTAGAGFWMLGARHERRWRTERGLPANF